jgi:hypothetical protein
MTTRWLPDKDARISSFCSSPITGALKRTPRRPLYGLEERDLRIP